MKLTALMAMFAFVLIGTSPAFAGPPDCDCDGDTIPDSVDNCRDDYNPGQDDTDGDDCGNVCDADFDNSGVVAFADFGAFAVAFGGFDLEKDLTEPVLGPVAFADFGRFSALIGSVPGPSGTTIGTLACP